ncbi:MAG: hypothetical protein DWQ06_14520 [Calditrichaeota bacterium]|nr:MAG: hypothetical protein DWQ06_14520 [Calditrichota bacterium]
MGIPKEKIVLLDGKIVSENEAKISVFDQAILYGESIFESMRVTKRTPLFLDLHLQRLEVSAKILGVKIPFTLTEIKNSVLSYLQKTSLSEGFLRMTLTAGSEDSNGNLFCFLLNKKLPSIENYEIGVKVKISDFKKPSLENFPSNIKSGNYLNSTLARREAQEDGFYETILLDTKGRIAECANSNIFFFKKNVLVTPSLTHSPILNGITRKVALNLAKQFKITASERVILPNEIPNFDECFLTNSFVGVLPISEIKNEFSKPVGGMTKLLLESYEALIQEEVSKK